MDKSKKNIPILCLSIIIISGITFLGGLTRAFPDYTLRVISLVVLNLSNGAVAFLAMKLCKMKIDIKFQGWQIPIGMTLALALSLVIAVIPASFGFSLVGGRTEFSLYALIYDLLFYMLIIGPVEEFIFRVYLQDAFVSFFPKRQWIGVIIAAFLFGIWHIINGSLIQALFTFGIGLAFGFTKHKIKDTGYIGVAFAHGLYDFLNTLVRMFIV